MKRQPPPKTNAGVALFPFLAVLLCTMGALLVLLVAIARHSRDVAIESARTSSDVDADVEAARTLWQQKLAELATSRDTLAARLAEQRGELSHLEEHTRRIRDELAQAQKAAEALEHADNSDDETNKKLRARVAQYDEEIRALANDVEQMRKAAQGQKNSYAIIPYDGPNQTRRRPIYIECRADAVILQPEGIVFDEADFMGPPGPGNPMSACLRAVREFLIRNHMSTPGDDGEPYPLLLVRPDGIPSYYMARNAMSGWGADFGYELIEQDWKLKFKPANLALASEAGRAVEEARRRQQMIAAAAPRLLSPEERLAYRTALANRSSAGGGQGNPGGGMGHGGIAAARGGNGVHHTGMSQAVGRAGSRFINSDEQQAANNAAALAPYANIDVAAGGNGRAGLGGGGGPDGLGGGSPQPGFGNGRGSTLPGAGQPGVGAGDPTGLSGQPGSQPLAGAWGAGDAWGSAGTTPGGGNGPGASGSPGGNSAAGGGGGGSPASSVGDRYAGFDQQGGAGSSSTSGGSGGAGNNPGGNNPGGNSATPGSNGAPTANPYKDLAIAGAGGSASGNGSGTGSAAASTQSSSPGGGPGSPGASGMSGGAAQGASASMSGAPQAAGGSPNLSATFGDKATSSDSGDGSSSGEVPGGAPPKKSSPPRSPFETAGKTYGGPPKRPAGAVSGGSNDSGAGEPPSGSSQSSNSSSLPPEQREKLAKRSRTKGRNWALPDDSHHTMPVTRPIQLQCEAGRLVMLNERGDRPKQKVVPLDGNTADAIEPLVGAVWERINSWGIAGEGMYWRPVLMVTIAADGRSRYDDLEALLYGSGLEVRSKQVNATSAKPSATGLPR